MSQSKITILHVLVGFMLGVALSYSAGYFTGKAVYFLINKVEPVTIKGKEYKAACVLPETLVYSYDKKGKHTYFIMLNCDGKTVARWVLPIPAPITADSLSLLEEEQVVLTF